MNNDILRRLAEPFEPSAITFKPGATKENKCMALAYADFRAYMDRLDEVCGIDWSCKYTPWGEGRIICELTIGGITRSSTGEADAQDEKNNLAGSVTEAMAFKRAASMWGLGRFLYSLPSTWVEFDPQKRRITEAGQRELEQRYKDWYKRQSTQKPQVERNGSNGHNHTAEVDFTPVAPANPFDDAPTSFSGPDAAISWGFAQGCFNHSSHAANAYAELKREHQPKSSAEMWSLWVSDVQTRMAEKEPV